MRLKVAYITVITVVCNPPLRYHTDHSANILPMIRIPQLTAHVCIPQSYPNKRVTPINTWIIEPSLKYIVYICNIVSFAINIHYAASYT